MSAALHCSHRVCLYQYQLRPCLASWRCGAAVLAATCTEQWGRAGSAASALSCGVKVRSLLLLSPPAAALHHHHHNHTSTTPSSPLSSITTISITTTKPHHYRYHHRFACFFLVLLPPLPLTTRSSQPQIPPQALSDLT